MKKKLLAGLATGLFMAGGMMALESAYAITYDFNDGTNQGWTVQFNDFTSQTAAGWYDYVNYTGSPTSGLPPVLGSGIYGTDPIDGQGAIVGSGPSIDWYFPVISSFASPIFAAEEVDEITAQFVISSGEAGIAPPSMPVWGVIGWHVVGEVGYWFGDFFTELNIDEESPENLIPLWTELSYSPSPGTVIDQIIVNIWMGNTSPLYEGTQNWIDNVSTSFTDPGGGPGNGTEPVPEPATMLLFGTGLAGLAGAARRKKAQKK